MRLIRKLATATTIARRWLKRQTVLGLGQVHLAPGSRVEPRARFEITHPSPLDNVITIGDGSVIKNDAYICPRSGFIRIGKRCSVNPFCVLIGNGGITMGDDVRIAAHTTIVAFNHVFGDPDAPIAQQGNVALGITIEDDVWIGSGVRILDGVRIGRGTVVGAGSVVTKDIPPWSVAVGVPARVIRKRKQDT